MEKVKLPRIQENPILPTSEQCMYCGRVESKLSIPAEEYVTVIPCEKCADKYSEGCLIVEMLDIGGEETIHKDFRRKFTRRLLAPSGEWLFLPTRHFGLITDSDIQSRVKAEPYLRLERKAYKIIKNLLLDKYKS